jgi:hypothetical protein
VQQPYERPVAKLRQGRSGLRIFGANHGL